MLVQYFASFILGLVYHEKRWNFAIESYQELFNLSEMPSFGGGTCLRMVVEQCFQVQ